MLVPAFLLWFLYLALTLLYTFAPSRAPAVPPWPLLSNPVSPPGVVLPATCGAHTDCPPHHACVVDRCLPKLLRGDHCDPATSHYVAFLLQGLLLAVCSCRTSAPFKQKFFGGDCNVPVACGAHGTYNLGTQACDCEPGYQAVHLTCQKQPVLEALTACEPNDLVVSRVDPDRDGFHPDYLASLRSVRCVKRPCSFDALSGRPLKHAKYEPGWGCVCDPTYGYFGVTLAGRNKRYLASEGFDACASLFRHDPTHPIEGVQFLTFFYLGQREPLSMIRYPRLRQEDLIPLLRGRGNALMITQSWRNDFAQHLFRHGPPMRAGTWQVQFRGFQPYGLATPVKDYVKAYVPSPCSVTSRYFRERGGRTSWSPYEVYTLLYQDPVCRVLDRRHPMFRDRVIVNPFHLTLEGHDDVPRYNAFTLKYDREGGVYQPRWTLDWEHAYEVDRYRTMDTNVPRY